MADPYTAPPVPHPTDAKPVDAQPADTQPSDTQPADTQPADTQPADAQPTGAAYRPTSPRGRGSNIYSEYDIFLYFAALFVPPFPVLLKRGFGAQFILNIILWIFGWIPGVVHSWYIIARSQGVI